MILKLWKFNDNDEIKTIKRHKPNQLILTTLCTNGFCATHDKNISISGLILKEKALKLCKELEVEHLKHQIVGYINLKHITIFILKLFVVKVNRLIRKLWTNGVSK